MQEISTELIKEAVYNLCLKANICLNYDIYSKIFNAYENEDNVEIKSRLKNILKNAKIAFEEKMPLCQDTGQVLVFLETGQDVIFTGDFIIEAINSAVLKCYGENFFRKSVVKNAVFERTNTKTNTPCIIYTKYTKEDNVKIKVLIKGAGSENKSKLKMLLPTANEDEIIQNCADMILEAGINACPPMFIGIGFGGTAEKALLLSKEALICNDFTKKEIELAKKIKLKVNEKAPDEYKNCFVLDVNLKTEQTHIACLPVGLTINCHSDRYSIAVIKDGQITYKHSIPEFREIAAEKKVIKEINTSDTAGLKSLKEGENVLLTGEIYVARDMAHKKMIELLNEGKTLPVDINNKIIFYAGPCPKPTGKISGSIGPTTAGRMDKYAIKLYKQGVFATIGKGTRSEEVKDFIKKSGKKYFVVQGGIAALLAQKVTSCEISAFEDFGAEAIYKIKVDKLPVKTEIA